MSDDQTERQDLISLRPTPRYRALLLSRDGRIFQHRRIQASNDEEAMSLASGLMDGRAVDLWDGLRFIETLPPID